MNATEHAEMAALRKGLLNSARGSTMYVARINSAGETRLARPCNRCMKRLYHAGVREVVYTTNDGSYKVERVRDLPQLTVKLGLDTRSAQPV